MGKSIRPSQFTIESKVTRPLVSHQVWPDSIKCALVAYKSTLTHRCASRTRLCTHAIGSGDLALMMMMIVEDDGEKCEDFHGASFLWVSLIYNIGHFDDIYFGRIVDGEKILRFACRERKWGNKSYNFRFRMFFAWKESLRPLMIYSVFFCCSKEKI